MKNDLLNQYYQQNTGTSEKRKASVVKKTERAQKFNRKNDTDARFKYNTRQRTAAQSGADTVKPNAAVIKRDAENHMDFDGDHFFPNNLEPNIICQEDIQRVSFKEIELLTLDKGILWRRELISGVRDKKKMDFNGK